MINYDLKKIRAVFFDVDGVLSCETIPQHPNGDPMRTVNIKDGYAMQHAVKCGLILAIITGGRTAAVRIRYESLGLKDVVLGAAVKIKAYNDLCGLPCCPADAAPEIKAVCTYISHKNGGQGCARDILEQILKAKDLWMHNSTAFGW